MDLASILPIPTPWIATVITIAYVIYWYGTSRFNYFKEQGVPGPEPLPYIGNLWGVWRMNLPKYDRELVRKYGKVYGCFHGTLPNLFTTDVEWIKAVFVKDFDHFTNRKLFEGRSKYIRKIISLIKDQEWKDVRSSVTPAFTAGKIKKMSVLIKECADRLANRLETVAKTEGKVDAKMQFSSFSMDVIARCAFGMKLDHLEENNNPFLEKALQAFGPPVFKSPAIMIPYVSPMFMTLFGERIMASGFTYFINFLEGVVKERADSTEKYNDFIELAREAISEVSVDDNGVKKRVWSKEEVDEIIVAQSTAFLLAGFDTTGATLMSAIYLLAKHPDIQEKLYQELHERLEVHGEVKHDMILNFPYMDHVINETLRLYPSGVRIERECNKDFTFKGVTIKKGMVVTVPVYALHYDEDYYPEPEKFNPDRWSPDSPIKPNPSTYLPFGMGPRNCIGMRFAIEELKITLCTLLDRFRFFTVPETPEQMEFQNGFQFIIQTFPTTVGIELRSP